MKLFLCSFSMLFVLACSGNEKSAQTKAIDSVNTGEETTKPVDVPSNKVTSRKEPVPGSSGWQYEKKFDQEGRTVYKASIASPTLLEFDFPYNGGSTATMTLRKRAADTHVYIQVSKGQFNRSFQGGQARIRFDGKTPLQYSFSAAENGSANVIFFDADQKLINQIKAAQNMVVDVEFAGQDKRQIAFRTAGLQWDH